MRGYHALLTKNLAKTLGYDNPPDLREQFYIGPLVSRAAEFAHIAGAAELYANGTVIRGRWSTAGPRRRPASPPIT